MSLPIYVIGHKHPDTDAICSSLALTALKEAQGVHAVAGRIGHLSPETAFILDKVGVEPPLYMNTAKCALSEIEIDEAVRVHPEDTIRSAWDVCLEHNVKTLYVVSDDDEYLGVCTINDISKIQMQDVSITKDLLKDTPLTNIVRALKGQFIYEGNLARSGYVRISDKRLNERNLEGAIMVLDDHEDDMFKSIVRGCAVVVCTQNYRPSDYIIEIAKQKGATLIQTPYNIMKVIQMIYRSIPVSFIMTPKEKIISFSQSEFVEQVESEMLKTRHSNYPVLFQNHLVGSVARYHLLKSEKKKFILVDHNEVKQSIDDIETAEIVEIVDHHRIGDIETSRPISFRNMIIGSTCSIVTMMYREANIRMSDKVALLCAYGMISDTLNFHSPTTTSIDLDLKAYLEKEYGLHFDEMAIELFENTATIKGKEFKNLLYNDTKEYILSGHRIDISQVFTYNLDDVDSIEEDFKAFMEQENKKRHYDLLMMVFTNVEGNGSRFICVGDLAHDVAPAVARFADQQFVSRKKQIVPSLAQVLL